MVRPAPSRNAAEFFAELSTRNKVRIEFLLRGMICALHLRERLSAVTQGKDSAKILGKLKVDPTQGEATTVGNIFVGTPPICRRLGVLHEELVRLDQKISQPL